MSPEAQRIAIAEACGKHQYLGMIGYGYRCTACGDFYQKEKHRIPDYLSDLNAMHEAENVLTDEQQVIYAEWLCGVCGCGGRYVWVAKHVSTELHATAAQRAEAFLRTLGLWVEP